MISDNANQKIKDIYYSLKFTLDLSEIEIKSNGVKLLINEILMNRHNLNKFDIECLELEYNNLKEKIEGFINNFKEKLQE